MASSSGLEDLKALAGVFSPSVIVSSDAEQAVCAAMKAGDDGTESRGTCMGFSKLATMTSFCEMSRERRASTWLGCAKNASISVLLGASSVSDSHSRRICITGAGPVRSVISGH